MKKVLIIYGSTTGNTEAMATMVQQALQQEGLEASVKDVTTASVDDLSSACDAILLGCPAYGDDTVELQDDFAEFFDKMDSVDLKGRSFAVFAPGDESYPFFCGSVDLLEEKIKSLGGTLLETGLKIDGDPKHAANDISTWAGGVAGRL